MVSSTPKLFKYHIQCGSVAECRLFSDPADVLQQAYLERSSRHKISLLFASPLPALDGCLTRSGQAANGSTVQNVIKSKRTTNCYKPLTWYTSRDKISSMSDLTRMIDLCV